MSTEQLESQLRQRFEFELEGRIRRLQSLSYKRIIGAHHFAAASTECLELYRDGYMIGTVMCAQALIQALLRFASERNGLPSKDHPESLIATLQEKAVITETSASLARKAWIHRNDFHHLNQGVESIDLEPKAETCIQAVTALEDDIFDFEIIEGKILPKHSIYWDDNKDGTVPVYLRNLDA